MIYERLGHTDLTVSKICLGTMTFGEQNTESEAHQQLDYALSQGVNFVDTAEIYAVPVSADTYTLTEQFIGSWIEKSGRRSDIILASKIVGPGPHLTWVRSPIDFSPKHIREALEGSLTRLKTDYLDLYQLHWPERKTNFFGRLGYEHVADDPWQENFHSILECLQALISEGKIRHFGISNETPWGAMRYLHLSEVNGLPRAVSIQNPYNLLNRSFEVGLAEIAMREELRLLAYSPMAFGLLSGKFHQKTDTPRDRLNQFKSMSRYKGEECWDATAHYLSIAEKYGVSLAKLALAFVNTRPFVASTIIGATTMDQLKENIDSIHVHLTKEMIQEINEVHKKFSNPAP